MKHLKGFNKINENYNYQNMNGILVIDDSAGEPIGFIVEATDIEKKLYEIVLFFSDNVDLYNIPSDLNPTSGDILIEGEDLHHDNKITLRLKSVPMY